MRLIDADALIPVTLTDGGYWTKEVYYKTDVDDAPTIYPPPNDPLTLEELREMYMEPVWLVSKKPSESNWDIFNGFCSKVACFVITSARIIDDYGKTWLAYRRKPEEGDLNAEET